MNHPRIHCCINWCAIILFLIPVVTTTTIPSLWGIFNPFAPVFIFGGLCLLFFDHISLKDCIRLKDKEFYLMLGGIVLSIINMILIKSRVGAFFTISSFLLLLYLANKIRFDNIQLASIAFTCFLIWFYWQFISNSIYGQTDFNPNGLALIIFAFFCIFICYFMYTVPTHFQLPQWSYYLITILFLSLITIRILSFKSRCALIATITWIITCYFLPKRKYTISLVLGTSIFMPVVYVLLWKSGLVDNITILGKRFASGRDIIWYEFFKVFMHHPLTGIGSDFDRMLPDLYYKNAHHALLNFLFVHGLPVFLIVLYLLYKRINDVVVSLSSPVKAVCLASIYGMLAAGSLENYYILAPFNALFLTILVMSNTYVHKPNDHLDSK